MKYTMIILKVILLRKDDFNNGIELFRKTQSGEIKLEEAKIQQNIFKSNLNEI